MSNTFSVGQLHRANAHAPIDSLHAMFNRLDDQLDFDLEMQDYEQELCESEMRHSLELFVLFRDQSAASETESNSRLAEMLKTLMRDNRARTSSDFMSQVHVDLGTYMKTLDIYCDIKTSTRRKQLDNNLKNCVDGDIHRAAHQMHAWAAKPPSLPGNQYTDALAKLLEVAKDSLSL
jgi:hypothetical protein